MKIILSRKGFDSSYGGVASPIFPDGTLLSLPIPDEQGTVTYTDLDWAGYPLGPLVEGLTRGRITRDRRAHLDPDLYPQICSRPAGWRPLFGQDGAAQSHLANQGVGIGDLFLFFGWFREVAASARSDDAGNYRYIKAAPDQQLIYGWLQVGTILQGDQLPQSAPTWAAWHPHCVGGRGPRNTLYLAADKLTLAGMVTPWAGAGVMGTYQAANCLTRPGALRTHWRLPKWFHPQALRPPLTYHTDPTRWQVDADYAYLRSAMRGQEFVFDTQHYPEAIAWVAQLVAAG